MNANERKEARIKLAEEYYALSKKLMSLGTMQVKEISTIVAKMKELDGVRRSLYLEGEEKLIVADIRKNSKLNGSSGSCYPGSAFGWGGYIKGGIGVDTDCITLPEWKMKNDTRLLEEAQKLVALREKSVSEPKLSRLEMRIAELAAKYRG